MEAAREFLEQVVLVDEETAERRESEAGMRRERLRRESRSRGVEGVGLVGRGEGERKEAAGTGMEQRAVMEARAEVEQASGKTVKELSRLWMYLGGAVPEN